MSWPRLALSLVATAFALALCGSAIVSAFPLHARQAPPAAQAPATPQVPAAAPADTPARLHDAWPEYPAGEAAPPAQPWLFQVTIDERGRVASVTPVTAPAGPAADAIVAAVRQWRYEPPSRAPFPVLVGINPAAGRHDPMYPPAGMGDSVGVPVKTRDVRPVYPAEANDAGVQGIVILNARVDAEGAVSMVQVVRSVPVLDRAAVEALLQWRYEPPGFPVEMTVTMNFTLK